MPRRYKIMRSHGRIYDPIKGKLIKAGLIVLAAGLLFVLGWLVYDPVIRALNANSESSEPESEPSALSSSQEEEPEPEPGVLDGSLHAAYAPVEVFTDDGLWAEFLSDAKNAGLNAVVFDMKDADGNVTYASQQASVAAVESELEAPADLDARVAALREAGFAAIARVYAFRDPLASTNDEDMAVRYMDADGVVWLDDALEQGGKSWLNPYSETAQKYVLDVVYDAISAGCDTVLLDGVSFPSDYGIRFAYFGERAAETDRQTVLREFTEKALAACEKRGVGMLLGCGGAQLFSGETAIYGGSPLVLPANGYSPSFFPSALVEMEGLPKTLSYASLPDDLGKVIASMTEALSLATAVELMPYVQAYEVGAADINAMTEALEAAGIDDYILYGAEDTEYLKGLGGLIAGEPEPEGGESAPESEDQNSSEESSESSSEESSESSSEESGESTDESSSEESSETSEPVSTEQPISSDRENPFAD